MCLEKICKSCGASKIISEFSKDRQKPDGFRAYCKSCIRITTLAYLAKNKEVLKAKRSTPEYRERARGWSRKSGKKQYPHQKIKKIQWAKNNPDRISAIQKRYRDNHPEKIRQHNKNTAHIRKRYKKERPWLVAMYGAKRRAFQAKATPIWLTKDHLLQIQDFYRSAKNKSEFHETPFHVDHIEPLLGKTSCGLHVPWNLRVIPAYDNLSKGNKLFNY